MDEEKDTPEIEQDEEEMEEDEEEWTTLEEDSSASRYRQHANHSNLPIEQIEIHDKLYACAPMCEQEDIRIARPLVRPIMSEAVNVSGASDENDEDEDETTVNGWNRATEGTISKWQRDISKSSFIYGEQLEANNARLQVALIVTVLVGSLMTILASVSITINSFVDNFAATISLDAILLVGAAVITTTNAFVKVFGWDSKVKELVRFIEKLDTQWFVFETEMNIPRDQRQTARDFIMRADGDYMHLMQQCPYISVSDYVAANQSYQTQLSENFVWQQKFKIGLNQKLKVK